MSHYQDAMDAILASEDDHSMHFEPRYDEANRQRAKSIVRNFLQSYDETSDKVNTSYTLLNSIQVIAEIDDSASARIRAM